MTCALSEPCDTTGSYRPMDGGSTRCTDEVACCLVADFGFPTEPYSISRFRGLLPLTWHICSELMKDVIVKVHQRIRRRTHPVIFGTNYLQSSVNRLCLHDMRPNIPPPSLDELPHNLIPKRMQLCRHEPSNTSLPTRKPDCVRCASPGQSTGRHATLL